MKLGRKLDLKFISRPTNPDGSISFYSFSSKIEQQITHNDIKSIENPQFKTFNDFVSIGLSIRIITFPKQSSDWKLAHCSCYVFDNSYMCQHIISIANTLGLLAESEDSESDYDDEPIFSTKRGRPKKTSKALIKE